MKQKQMLSIRQKEPFLHREGVAGIVFCLPFIIGFLFFLVIPMMNSVYYSFCNYNITKPPVFIGLDNYTKLFQDAKFWKSLGVTLKYAVISVPLKLVFALLVAVLLLRNTKATPVYRAVYYLPSIMGASVAVSILWKRMFALDGFLNQILHTEIAWLGRPQTAMGVLILLAVWQFGSSMLIFIASMKQIPQTLYEAAEIDGATRPKIFFQITLPLLSSTIFFNLVMQTINGLLVFAQGQIITAGKPLNSTLFYVLYMYQQAFDFYKVGYSAALGWVLMLIVGLFTLLLFLSKRFWVYEGGIDRMENHGKRNPIFTILYHAFILLFGFIMLYPLLWMVLSSFKPTSTIINTADQLIPTVVTLDNYVNGWRGFSNTTFMTFFRNTLFVVCVSTVGVLLTTPMVAYGLARIRFKLRNVLFVLVLGTMMLPEQIMMIPQYLWYNQLGWVNTYYPLVVPHFFAVSGFFVYLMMNFINGIPRDLDEAAKLDGCSLYSIYTRIILPLLTPAMATVAIFSFLNRWNDYMSPLLYIRRTKNYTISLALKLFCDTTATSDYGALFAMSTLSLLPIFIIFITMQKYLTQGVVTSGLKG